MLTKHEISALNLSPTKKDFVQIWNELLDVAGKLSERWDPTSTNESDPGIVILKALTGIADKLNYNIDKNTLEAFMPSAAQEDSMRKLCEMLGYNIKYYQAATAEVTVKYHNTDPEDDEYDTIVAGLEIPKFTQISSADGSINYFTINNSHNRISLTQPANLTCLEGQLCKCTSINDNDVITINQISEDNRFYFQETSIAENGIFVYNIFYNNTIDASDSGISDGEQWKKVDNLNTQAKGSKVFKFGFDSYEGLPYIEFPEDYSSLFDDGIFIYYSRTSGINGNISAHTLTQMSLPSSAGWEKVSADSFSVDNSFAATTGANIETINQAYNNFKKTVGTFNTLVTCRDYMNYIYNMLDDTGRPRVSNVLVTDIRNDINRAITICSCDDSGILFKDKALPDETDHTPQISSTKLKNDRIVHTENKPVFKSDAIYHWRLGEDGVALLDFITGENADEFDINKDGIVEQGATHWTISQNGNKFDTIIPVITSTNSVILEKVTASKPKINHFDLVIYPFKTYNQINNNVSSIRQVYDDSFSLMTGGGVSSLISNLDDENSDKKTIAHSLITPKEGDLISINNYLRLNATIATTSKLTEEEGTFIIENIKKALANAFNMRELDFGEEIPFESIVSVMEKADARIKHISLNEPALYTTFSEFKRFNKLGRPEIAEYAVASDVMTVAEAKTLDRFYKGEDGAFTFDTVYAKELYNKMIVRNILAGRVPLFKYNKTFTSNFYEKPCQIIHEVGKSAVPLGLTEQNTADTYRIYADDKGTVYTARTINNDGVDKTTYEEIETPYADYGNVIEEDELHNEITEIQTFSNITTDEQGTISNLTLNDGEYVRFRAPNFITTKTYPAYVNYNLQLAKDLNTGAGNGASFAEAVTLYDLINNPASMTADVCRQAVLDYFGKLDEAANRTGKENALKKTFTISQKISKYTPAASTGDDKCTGDGNEGNDHVKDEATGKCKYCGATIYNEVHSGPLNVSVKGDPDSQLDINKLFVQSGFVKLLNNNFTARLEWDTSDGDTAPNGPVPLTIQLDLDEDSHYIADVDIIEKIQTAVDSIIEQSKNKVKSATDSTPILPTACAWTVSFDFECVPFSSTSLYEWEKFIRYCSKTEDAIYTNILNFKPAEERGSIFWRTYGQAYDPGKYVLENTEKLLRFEKNFDLLPTNNLQQGIYIAKTLGADIEPAIIENNKEYQLDDNEYLYIEYTPSTTSEDGTQQEQPPKMEILGPGTIIKPSGFAKGLMDSDDFAKLGNTPHKQVTFENISNPIDMFRFAANEQLEVREFAKVTLSKETLNNSDYIHVYKNFNNCEPLEESSTEIDGALPTRSYTLKDGEYVFYTDSQKTDFAYYGSGTEIILTGNAKIPACDVVDIATILDYGINEIPWQYLTLNDPENSLTFKEYQYITLGPKDTINSLTIGESDAAGTQILGAEWTKCREGYEVSYKAFEAAKSEKLPAIVVSDDEGWEVTSLLELNASPASSQTLRYIKDTISTGLVLNSVQADGDGQNSTVIAPEVAETSTLEFKTNVACNTGNNYVSINDSYINKNGETSFKLKIFEADAPTIVQTRPGKVVPLSSNVPFAKWHGSPLLEKDLLDVWNTVSLDSIKPGVTKSGVSFDTALALPVLLTSNTYGIVSFYLNYTTVLDSQFIEDQKTWIEIIPGTRHSAIEILNADNSWEAAEDRKTGQSDRLYLQPGINCIRFNQSGKYFIKAASTAKGVLYFDDLKLVDCATINFKNKDDINTTLLTRGLNLDQLGYISTSATDTIDDATLLSLSKELCNSFTRNANEIAVDTLKEYNTATAPFLAALPTLEKFNADLTTADSFTDKNLQDIENTLSALKNNIKLENELKETLKTKTADNQLINFISKLATKEVAQEQLLTLLDTIKSKIESNIKGRAAGKSVLSFKNSLSASDKKSLQAVAKDALIETRNVLLQKVHDDFAAELEGFAAALESIVAGKDFTKVKEALTGITKLELGTEAAKTKLNDFITNKLNPGTDNRITDIINNIDTTYTSYKTLRDDIAGITDSTAWITINTAAYAKDFKAEVASIWSNYLLEFAMQELSKIEADLLIAIATDDSDTADALLDSTKTQTDTGLATIKGLNEKLTTYFGTFVTVDHKALEKDQLEVLVDNIENMCINISESASISGTVTTLGGILGLTIDTSKFSSLGSKKISALLTDLAKTTNTQTTKAELLIELEEALNTDLNANIELLGIIEKHLYPSIVSVRQNSTADSFEYLLAKELTKNFVSALDANIAKFEQIFNSIKYLANGPLGKDKDTGTLNLELFKGVLDTVTDTNQFFKITFEDKQVSKWFDDIYMLFKIINYVDNLNTVDLASKTSVDDILSYLNSSPEYVVNPSEVKTLQDNLAAEINDLKAKKISDLDSETSASMKTFMLEEQLLAEILRSDFDRDFYYTAPVDSSLEIDIGRNLDGKQTLANPALNYDINNINNSFVISKIDIDYLDNGIKLARSSKISY